MKKLGTSFSPDSMSAHAPGMLRVRRVLAQSSNTRDDLIKRLSLLHGLSARELHLLSCADVHSRGDSTALQVAAEGQVRLVFLGPETASLLRSWLEERSARTASTPLFTSLIRQNEARRLSQSAIARLLRAAWAGGAAGE